jgi:hypothetical protein
MTTETEQRRTAEAEKPESPQLEVDRVYVLRFGDHVVAENSLYTGERTGNGDTRHSFIYEDQTPHDGGCISEECMREGDFTVEDSVVTLRAGGKTRGQVLAIEGRDEENYRKLHDRIEGGKK